MSIAEEKESRCPTTKGGAVAPRCGRARVRPRRLRPPYILAAAFALAAACGPSVGDEDLVAAPRVAAASSVAAGGNYDDLLALFAQFQELQTAPSGGADWSPEAMRRRFEGISGLQRRLGEIGPADWPVPRHVDYLVVRSMLDREEFLHRVSRPWARDPGFYVDRLMQITFAELPVEGEALERLRTRLAAVPGLLERAREHLTGPAADYAALAIRNLETADGVGHGHPYRATPPAGVLGWYDDLLGRALRQQPEVVADVEAAQRSVEAFHRWLSDNRDSWTAAAGVGRANFDWYLRHVKFMPYDNVDVARLAKREYERLTAFLAFERNRNADLPEIEPAGSAEDYQQRIRDADEHVRAFIRDKNMLTIPEFVGELDTNVPWIERPGGRNFWEEIQFRDPRPDHVHAVIPGHRFDGLVAAQQDHPIRSTYAEGGRVEGWAYYLEETFLQNGLLDERPRTRELYYIFGIKRTVRVAAEVNMHLNQFTVAEATTYMVDRVPFLDANVARVDAEIYLRRPPGYGLSYLIGGLEISKLVADRYRQLGDAEFNLGEFHDEYLAAGRIPTSLIRWELTGLSDEVEGYWTREPIPEPR